MVIKTKEYGIYKCNEKFLNSISDDELEKIMSEFDHVELCTNSWFYSYKSLSEYLSYIYQKNKLFSEFKEKERKSINLEDQTNGPLNFYNYIS